MDQKELKRRYTLLLSCAKCGHTWSAVPSVVAADKHNDTPYYGSDRDFCPRCDGPPKVVGMQG